MPRGDFVLVTHPERQPAVDYITGTGAGPFVDTGVDVKWKPSLREHPDRIYLSVDTIRALAKVAGVLEDGDISEQREATLIAQGKIEGLREGLGNDLADVARTLRRWLDDAGIGSDDDPDTSAL